MLDIPSPESDTREKSKEEREREKTLRTAGRELLGQQGVYCIACHNFNGKPAPVNKGIDLMTILRATAAWLVQQLCTQSGQVPTTHRDALFMARWSRRS